MVPLVAEGPGWLPEDVGSPEGAGVSEAEPDGSTGADEVGRGPPEVGTTEPLGPGDWDEPPGTTTAPEVDDSVAEPDGLGAPVGSAEETGAEVGFVPSEVDCEGETPP